MKLAKVFQCSACDKALGNQGGLRSHQNHCAKYRAKVSLTAAKREEMYLRRKAKSDAADQNVIEIDNDGDSSTVEGPRAPSIDVSGDDGDGVDKKNCPTHRADSEMAVEPSQTPTASLLAPTAPQPAPTAPSPAPTLSPIAPTPLTSRASRAASGARTPASSARRGRQHRAT